MKEIYLPIKGIPYEVSNLGNVRNAVTRKQISKWSKDRYLKVNLRKNGKQVKMYVHRLVAEAFIPNPDKKEQVNHKDFDRSNNRAANLEWMTRDENMKYSMENKNSRFNIPRTSTGVKNISKNRNCYELRVKRKNKKVCKCFKTLEQAIAYKETNITPY